MSRPIRCKICGDSVEAVEPHLREKHRHVDIGLYLKRFPKAPIFSARELARLSSASDLTDAPPFRVVTRPSTIAAKFDSLDLVFGLASRAAAPAEGEEIPVRVFSRDDFPGLVDFVPEVDKRYIFNPQLLQTVMLGLELNIPVYLWGHAGTGKSSAFEQICARTQRPMLRVQHTASMEESHVIGQYVLRDGATVWEDGPLPFAMRGGMLYLADEYDFAMPHVLSLYQPALEGKPLVIKEAPADLRVVRPHPEFRFCATGNTNGAGDDTGLYQGTSLQNFANFERYGVVERVDWLAKKQEVTALCAQCGVSRRDAATLVDFAAEIRRAHDAGKIGATLSLRAMVHAGRIVRRRGGWRAALTLAFTNRLNATDREVCDQIAQRHFG